MKIRFLLPFVIVAALAVFFWRGLFLDPTRVPSPLVGKPVPEFELPTLHDPDRTVSDAWFRGKVSLMNVFGTWCPGCHEEHGLLVEFARSSDVPILGLNWALGVDAAKEQQAARDWLARTGNPYAEIVADGEGSVAIDWGVYGAPETFVVDANGIIRYKHIGVLTPGVLQQEILPLLKQLRAESGTSGGGS